MSSSSTLASVGYYIMCFIAVEVLCIIGVAADYYLKLAGSGPGFIILKPFLLGTILYASTAFGWFMIMKYATLVQIGVLYGVSIILLVAALGVFKFNEQLSVNEIVGISLAVIGVMLTARLQ